MLFAVNDNVLVMKIQITSANRDPRYLLAPDFTFHIDYRKNEVTIYKDYGPGCVHRIFLYPWLPTNYEVLHRMTSANLSDMFLKFEIDERPPGLLRQLISYHRRRNHRS